MAGLYLIDLAGTPVYFGGDEAHFAVGAHAVATTGRNVNGDLLPVFFNLADPLGGPRQVWGDTWYQPMLHYLVAAFIAVLPYTITTVRLPMAIVGGLITPLLLYFLARRLTGRTLPAVIAALIVSLAPVHLVLSRQALDYVLPLPIMIGWLLCLHSFLETKHPKFVIVAGFLLGAGCYSYIASWALMPLYLLITWVVIWRAGLGFRPIVQSAIAFALPVMAAPLWVLWHPEMLTETAARYSVSEGPRHGVIETYLSVIHPNVLFVRGGPSMVTATAKSGFVLLPVGLLLVAGIAGLWRRRGWISWVIVVGLVTAPLPAALKAEPLMIQRAMYLLPFFALLGAFGFAELWDSRSRLLRYAALAVMVASPIQFAYFYYDYVGHYKLRSAFYYDPVAFQDVARHLIASTDTPAFYFTNDLDDASVKWRFYTVGHGRGELLARTRYIEPEDRPPAVPRSLLVTYDLSARIAALQADGWAIEGLVKDVDSRPAAVILRRIR